LNNIVVNLLIHNIINRKIYTEIIIVFFKNSKTFVNNRLGYEIIDFDSFGRRHIIAAKQILAQKIKKVEKANIYEAFEERIGEVIMGSVHQITPREIKINYDDIEVIMPKSESIFNERYRRGELVKAVIKDVYFKNQDVKIIVTRSDKEFIIRLFELEVPEIYDGLITIKNIVREPGERAKVAVESYDDRIDPVGACVGMKGVRIQSIVQELNGEMIDVVRWNDDPKILISNLLKPAEISYIYINEEEKKAIVIVSEDQLSLAIGNKGVNAKLAAKASGWNIDIKTEDQFEEIRKLEASRLKAEEALGLVSESVPEETVIEEEIEYEIDSDFQFWQEGSHNQSIENDSIMWQKLEYIHFNPVKRGYIDSPEYWRYSSARNYNGDAGLIEVCTKW